MKKRKRSFYTEDVVIRLESVLLSTPHGLSLHHLLIDLAISSMCARQVADGHEEFINYFSVGEAEDLLEQLHPISTTI